MPSQGGMLCLDLGNMWRCDSASCHQHFCHWEMQNGDRILRFCFHLWAGIPTYSQVAFAQGRIKAWFFPVIFPVFKMMNWFPVLQGGWIVPFFFFFLNVIIMNTWVYTWVAIYCNSCSFFKAQIISTWLIGSSGCLPSTFDKHHSLWQLPCSLLWQDVPGSSKLILPQTGNQPLPSEALPGSFWWEMVF